MNKQADVNYPFDQANYSRSWQQLLRAQRQTIRKNATAKNMSTALYLVRGIMAKGYYDDSVIDVGHRILG